MGIAQGMEILINLAESLIKRSDIGFYLSEEEVMLINYLTKHTIKTLIMSSFMTRFHQKKSQDYFLGVMLV